jgi:hypothetical protein
MSTVQEIERAIERLSPEDFRALEAWMAERAAQWDQKFEADVQAGKLDWLIDEVRVEKAAGRVTDL